MTIFFSISQIEWEKGANEPTVSACMYWKFTKAIYQKPAASFDSSSNRVPNIFYTIAHKVHIFYRKSNIFLWWCAFQTHTHTQHMLLNISFCFKSHRTLVCTESESAIQMSERMTEWFDSANAYLKRRNARCY